MRRRCPAVLLLVAACSQSPRPSRPIEATATDASVGRDAEGEATQGPREARRWRLLRMRDENGNLRPDDVQRAHAQRRALAAVQARAGIGRLGWTQVGPGNVGGRTRSLLIHPTNPLELWAGAVGGGVWHSTDGGLSWAPQDDFMGNLAVCCLAMTPGNPAVLYAGTGESAIFNFDAVLGGGIWKTTNGGASWSLLLSTTGLGDVNRIAVSPANPSIVLAATRSGIHRSADGGSSWTAVRPASVTAYQVLFDPNNASRCLASVFDSGGHAVVLSVDAGLTWATAASGLGLTTERIELAYAKANANVVYASVGVGQGQSWRSVDGGNNWLQRAGNGLQSNGQLWYDNAIWVDPTNSNLVLHGANDVYRSFDGGDNFTPIGSGYILTQNPHPDVHGLIAEPQFDGVAHRGLYVCSDGGLHYSTDIYSASPSSTWSSRVADYRTTQFYGAAGDGPSGRICGGTQDNGHLTIHTTAGTAATLTFGGDGGFAAMDPTDPNYLYGEYVYLQIHRSTDGGASAGYITTGLGAAGNSGNANFIAPFVLDPNNPSTMLAGGRSLWRCTNVKAGTPTWSNVKAAFGTSVGTAAISAIAVAPGNSNIVWVGHNGGRVYRSTDATAASPTWTAIDDNAASNPLPNRYVARLLIDHTDSNKVWVCLGGFTANNVWLTTDGGATWAPRSGALPQAPVNGICQHPTIANNLYLATEVGVFASSDYGLSWSTGNDGPADVSVDEVTFLHNSSTLLVATHGRGLWTTPVQEPVVATFGTGCAGSNGTPSLLATTPRLGTTVNFIGTNLPPGQLGVLVLGGSNSTWSGAPLPADLAALGAPNCFLRVGIDQLFQVAANAGGTAFTTVTIPSDRQLIGARGFLQLFVADPGTNVLGIIGSNGVALTVGL